MKYNEDGTVTPLPPIVVECPIHGECAGCVELAGEIEAYDRGRAEALAEVRRELDTTTSYCIPLGRYAEGWVGGLDALLRRLQDSDQ